MSVPSIDSASYVQPIRCLPAVDQYLQLAAARARAADIDRWLPVPQLALRPASML